MKRIASILILLHLTIICFGQAGAIAKGVGKTFAKKAAKETVEAASEAATKKIAKETSEEIAEQYAKKVARENLMEQIEKKGYRYFSDFYRAQAKARLPEASRQAFKASDLPIRKANYGKKLRAVTKADAPNPKALTKKALRLLPNDVPNAKAIEETIEAICKKYPGAFDPNKFTCVKTKKGYLIQYIGNPTGNANTSILVRMDGVIEASSAKVGFGKVLNGTNEFLTNLLPNQKYLIDDAITIETDAYGRIIKSSGDYNKLIAGRTEAPRNSSLQKQLGRDIGGDSYEGGHLYPHSAGGPDEVEVPMHYDINHNPLWRKLEDTESAMAQKGAKVDSTIQLIYEGESKVPTKIIKTSIINGKKTVLSCNNITGEVIQVLS